MKVTGKYLTNIIFVVVTILLETGCASLPENINNPPSFAYHNTNNTRLGKAVQPLIKNHTPKSGVFPLVNGVDAFTARYILVKAAEKTIDVQYYIWHNDTTGKLLTDALIKAADRGVRVRLLLDDINMAGMDNALLALHDHKNIQVRLFNPFPNRSFRAFDFITDFSRVNRRMHNKSFTVDNQASIVGGRNIGDEYFDANPAVGFHDFDLLSIGPAVKQVSDQFDLYWNHTRAYPINVLEKNSDVNNNRLLKKKLDDFIASLKNNIYIKAVKKSDFLNKIKKKKIEFYWDDAQVLYDEPDKIINDHDAAANNLLPKILPILKDTSKEIIIISPYFIPGDEGVNRIKELAKRGVSIKILTNSLASTDVPIVYSGYAPYRVPLLNNKVDLYEIKSTYRTADKKKSFGSSSRSSLHSKIYVFDRKKIFVGSYNLDPRSAKINTEMGILVSNTELAVHIGEWWDKTINKVAYKLDLESIEGEYGFEQLIVWLDNSVKPIKRYEESPKASLWKKFSSDLFSILPLEDQL